LNSTPDNLIAADLTALLDGCPLIREIVVLEETGSTNSEVARLASGGAREGLVVFAESQSAGRGRLGRKWESSPRQGLWFSLLLRPRTPVALWTRLAPWAALGVAEGIENVVGCRASIKWPNDIFIGDKKTAGILIESQAGPDGFAVVGIGVNVNQEHFPEPIAHTAISLRQAAGHPADRPLLAVAILRQLDRWSRLLESGFHEIVAASESRSYLRGRWVEMRAGTETIEGIAGELDETGALRVLQSDGKTVSISSGEVTVAAHRAVS